MAQLHQLPRNEKEDLKKVFVNLPVDVLPTQDFKTLFQNSTTPSLGHAIDVLLRALEKLIKFRSHYTDILRREKTQAGIIRRDSESVMQRQDYMTKSAINKIAKNLSFLFEDLGDDLKHKIEKSINRIYTHLGPYMGTVLWSGGANVRRLIGLEPKDKSKVFAIEKPKLQDGYLGVMKAGILKLKAVPGGKDLYRLTHHPKGIYDCLARVKKREGNVFILKLVNRDYARKIGDIRISQN